MPFRTIDLPGYQGKEIEVWVFDEDNGAYILRGAQNFNTTEERAETRVSEMGFDATKVLYGATTYSGSCSLLVRDLVQIARLSGIDPTNAKRINVNDFKPVNVICWYKNPNTGEVVQTKYIGGFKSRTASTSQAVDANATITLEGGADLVATVDGKAKVVQYIADGTTNLFDSKVTNADKVLIVEYPIGAINDEWQFVSPKYVKLPVTPDEGEIVRIVYAV